jgi:hypothetical protein
VRSLPDAEPVASGPFDRRAVSGVIDRFLAGHDEWSAVVRALALIVVWHEACVSNSGGSRTADQRYARPA